MLMLCSEGPWFHPWEVDAIGQVEETGLERQWLSKATSWSVPFAEPFRWASLLNPSESHWGLVLDSGQGVPTCL